MRISKMCEVYIASSNFAEINNLLTSVQGRATFFGSRVVTISGYEGSLSIDALAR